MQQNTPEHHLKKPPSVVTQQDIATIVSKLFDVPEETVMNATSIHDIAHQSLDKIELICALEDHYHITLNLEDDQYLSNWDRIIPYLQHKVELTQKNES